MLFPFAPDISPTPEAKKFLDKLIRPLEIGFFEYIRKVTSPVTTIKDQEERWHRCFEYNLHEFLIPAINKNTSKCALVRKYIFGKENGEKITRADLDPYLIDKNTRPSTDFFQGDGKNLPPIKPLIPNKNKETDETNHSYGKVASTNTFVSFIVKDKEVSKSQHAHEFKTAITAKKDTSEDGYSILVSYGPKYDADGKIIKENVRKAKAVTAFYDILLFGGGTSRVYEEIKEKNNEDKEQIMCCMRFNPSLKTVNYIRGLFIHLHREFDKEFGMNENELLLHKAQVQEKGKFLRTEVQEWVNNVLPEKITSNRNLKGNKFPVQTKSDGLTSIIVANGFCAYGKIKTPEGKYLNCQKHKKHIDSLPEQTVPKILKGLPEKSGAFIDASGRIFKLNGFFEKATYHLVKLSLVNHPNKEQIANNYGIWIGNIMRDHIGFRTYRFLSTMNPKYANQAFEQALDDMIGQYNSTRKRRLAVFARSHNPVTFWITPAIKIAEAAFTVASCLVGIPTYSLIKGTASLLGYGDWDPINKGWKSKIENKYKFSYTGPTDSEIDKASIKNKITVNKEKQKEPSGMAQSASPHIVQNCATTPCLPKSARITAAQEYHFG